MFFTYLGRELRQRRRQTLIVASGLALAIALVTVVTSVAAGVGNAQDQVLATLYGVGTDVTVTMPPEPGLGGRQQFEVGEDEGVPTDEGGREFGQERLMTAPGSTAFDASTAQSVAEVDGVAAVSGALSLTSISFSGELPTFDSANPPGAGAEPPEAGAGGSTFEFNTLSVLGVDSSNSKVGPLTATTVAEGRALNADDADADVALVDSTYATANEIAIGDTLTVGGRDVTVVGAVSPTSADEATSSDVYLPLALAQELSDSADQVSTLYVLAESADAIPAVQADIQALLPDATVNTSADLAESVSGSLTNAATLARTLGGWLAGLVLAAAFALAVLFTLSAVARRVREFGTLKAIGWRSRRIVGQVMGESLVQGLLGGLAGLALGLGAVAIIDAAGPELSASLGFAAPDTARGGPGGIAGGPFGGGLASSVGSEVGVVLHAPVTLQVIILAVALALAGGLLAGSIGGWRAARLSPAAALSKAD